MRLSLVCDAPWVEHPTHFDLMNMERSFSIKVNPKGLAEGEHFTEVRHCNF